MQVSTFSIVQTLLERFCLDAELVIKYNEFIIMVLKVTNSTILLITGSRASGKALGNGHWFERLRFAIGTAIC